MAMRLSGLMSGMDTESIISQLVEAKKTKVTKAVKAQKSLKYKQDAWKSLNTQILKLYNGALSNMRFESSFMKKTTKVSNSSVVSVITGEGAMNSVQNLRVDKLAKSGYLTGTEISRTDGEDIKADETTLGDLGFSDTATGSIKIALGDGAGSNITVSSSTTVSDFVKSLKDAGLNASFDEVNQRFYVASKASGKKNDFTIMGNNGDGVDALKAMGLLYSDSGITAKYDKIITEGTDGTAFNAKMDSKLNSLKSSRDAELAKQDAIIEKLKKHSAELDTELTAAGKSIDWDNLDLTDSNQMNAIVAAADNLIAAAADGDAVKTDLVGWKNDWDVSKTKQSEIEASLDIDASGTVTGWNTGSTEYADIQTQMQAEVDAAVQNAQDAKAKLTGNLAQKTAADDAVIYLNDVEYTSDKNSFQINGLTLTVNAKTAPGEEVTITTEDDTDGIYDMVRSFMKEYNALINQMDKLYNADSAKDYEPLTDEEKESMSDSEIEEWETKIKDSILRKDSSLYTISNAMKTIMMEGVEVNGEKMYLSNFGIETLGYFVAADNEHNAYHIAGDPDDEKTSGNEDKLKTAIANDPQTVVDFFTGLSRKLYSEMTEKMKGTDYSSSYTAYDDKKMQTEYDDYTTKIKDLEKKLADYEDKWYQKFAAMETAMAKMQQNASAVTGLLGGSS